jgi:hypothetical protein
MESGEPLINKPKAFLEEELSEAYNGCKDSTMLANDTNLSAAERDDYARHAAMFLRRIETIMRAIAFVVKNGPGN